MKVCLDDLQACEIEFKKRWLHQYNTIGRVWEDYEIGSSREKLMTNSREEGQEFNKGLAQKE